MDNLPSSPSTTPPRRALRTLRCMVWVGYVAALCALAGGVACVRGVACAGLWRWLVPDWPWCALVALTAWAAALLLLCGHTGGAARR